MKTSYNENFYSNRHSQTTYAAEKILSIVLKHTPDIRSALDLGCGVGTWLSVLKEKGIKEVHGVDGPWVDTELLMIERNEFEVIDMSKEFIVNTKYDLAISLEVAEHLPPNAAKSLVDTLTAASNIVLFSAAVPAQGGTNHLNEQWQDYWAELFKQKGYQHLDIVRREIWGDERISFWYKQNILLYVHESVVNKFPEAECINDLPLRIVHPEMAIKLTKEAIPTFRECTRIMKKKIIKKIKRSL